MQLCSEPTACWQPTTPKKEAFILHVHACSAGLACSCGLMSCPCSQCLSLAVCSESVQFRTMGPSEMTSAGELHVFQGNLYTANDVSCTTWTSASSPTGPPHHALICLLHCIAICKLCFRFAALHSLIDGIH